MIDIKWQIFQLYAQNRVIIKGLIEKKELVEKNHKFQIFCQLFCKTQVLFPYINGDAYNKKQNCILICIYCDQMIKKHVSPYAQVGNEPQNLNKQYRQDPDQKMQNNQISFNSSCQPNQENIEIQSYIEEEVLDHNKKLKKQQVTNTFQQQNDENKNQVSQSITHPNMKKVNSEIISQYSNPVSPSYELTDGDNLCSIELSLNKSQRKVGKKLLNNRKKFNNYEESINRQKNNEGGLQKQIESIEDSDKQQNEQLGFIGRFHSAGNGSPELNKKRFFQIKKCLSSHGELTDVNIDIKNSPNEMKIKITQGQSGSQETPQGSVHNKSQQKSMDLIENLSEPLRIQKSLQLSQSPSESQKTLNNNSKSERNGTFKKKQSSSPEKQSSSHSYNSFFNVPSFINIEQNSKIEQKLSISKEEQSKEKNKIKPSQMSPISLYSFRLNRNDESQIPVSSNYSNNVNSLQNIEQENQNQSNSVITSNLNSMVNSNNLIKNENLTMSQSLIGKKEEQNNIEHSNLAQTTKLDCLTNGSSRGPASSLFNNHVQIKYIYNSNDYSEKQFVRNQRILNMKNRRKKNEGIQQYQHISSYQVSSANLDQNRPQQPHINIVYGPNPSTVSQEQKNNYLQHSLLYTPIKTERSYSPDHPHNYIQLPEFNSAQFTRYEGNQPNYPQPDLTPSKNTIQESFFSENNNSKILQIKHLLPQTSNKKEQAFSYDYCHSEPKPSIHSLANTAKPRTNSNYNRSVDIKEKIREKVDRRLRVTCVQSVDKKKENSLGGKINMGGILQKLDEYRRNNGIKLTQTLIDSGHKVYYQSQYQYNQQFNSNTEDYNIIKNYSQNNSGGCFNSDRDNKIGKYVQLSKETKKNMKKESCTQNCCNILCRCRPCPEEDTSLNSNKPKRINLTSINNSQYL